MDFDWMDYSAPAEITERNAQRRAERYRLDISKRAAMLHRLGYGAPYIRHRCLGNIAWAHEIGGAAPISKEEVRRLVDEACKTKL